MARKIYNPLISVGIQDFFDPKNDIKEAVNTDAVIMKDTSGNKKWSIKHNTNIVKYDHYSPEPDNKMVNSGFETDLSSWTSVLSYILNDQFTTDRAAGAVNGTSAEPTGGTRTVVDTNSKLSITGGQLTGITGGVAEGNPGLWYPLVTRSTGMILTGNITATGSGYYQFGIDSNQSGLALTGIYMRPGGNINTVEGLQIGGNTSGTAYQLAIVVRTTGYYYFIKGGTFTNWTLLWQYNVGSNATFYPTILSAINNVNFTADNIRIPTSTWLPTSLAFDDGS